MEELKKIRKHFEKKLKEIVDPKVLETLEVEYLGRKGKLTQILRSLKNRTGAERRKIGKAANELKERLERLFAVAKKDLETKHLERSLREERIDVTAPGHSMPVGGVHPLTKAAREVIDIFGRMGFAVAEGPEAETERYNFDALNIPADHPAREMWDTLWLKPERTNPKSMPAGLAGKIRNPKLLMRTHTSPVQIRFMETHRPPFKIISPGRVFRHEATDASHDIQFWQLEGLAIGREVSVANLKWTLESFFNQFFQPKAGELAVEIRLRPSYFPFTEPSFEVDMRGGDGDWMEIAGAGMVHPQVLRNCGIDPNLWQGFAFGMGIDRLAMLKYKIPDIRLFRENDIKFLKQFIGK